MKKILLVEDEPDLQMLMKERISRSGYEVETASDGEDAVEKVTSFQPDLIVLDVMLPKLSGFDVLEKIKGDEKTSGIPVIMLTAKTAQEDVAKGIRLYADKYITKPFQPADLIEEIRKTLATVQLQGDIPVAPISFWQRLKNYFGAVRRKP